MKIIRCLVVAASALIAGTTQASVVRYLQVSGSGVWGGELTGNVNYQWQEAFLDSSGVLSFTVQGTGWNGIYGNVTVTDQISINGVIASSGSFTPAAGGITSTLNSCSVAGCPTTQPLTSFSSIQVTGPSSIQAIATFASGLITLTENFTFYQPCSLGNIPDTACQIPIFTEAVPIPASIWLFSSGLIGTFATKRRRMH